ncbi:MAG: hypothetical protein KDC43_06345 [Saprospiraceae bacterium]|nr:hypothetical protein [Saprospiraceae bacterium]
MSRTSSLLLFALFVLLSTACRREAIKPSDLVFADTQTGCGDFFLYRYSLDGKTGLVVSGRREALGLHPLQEKEFTLPVGPDLEVRLDRFNRSQESYYCNDVFDGKDKIINQYFAVDGKVSIELLEEPQEFGDTYRLHLILEAIRFEDDSGREVELDHAQFEAVQVGWLPG